MKPLLYDERGEPLVMRDDERDENYLVGGADALKPQEPQPMTFALPMPSYDKLELRRIVPYTIPEVVDQYGSTKPRHRRVARGTADRGEQSAAVENHAAVVVRQALGSRSRCNLAPVGAAQRSATGEAAARRRRALARVLRHRV